MNFTEIAQNRQSCRKYDPSREIEKEKLYPARWQSLIEYYGFDCKAQAISDKYIERLATKSYMLDGALELCRKLHGKFKMYIVTNGYSEEQTFPVSDIQIFRGMLYLGGYRL